MKTNALDTSSLAQRIEQLEHRCARARRIAATALVIGVALPALAFLPQDAAHQKLETQKLETLRGSGFEVVGNDGKVRARLGLDKEGSPEMRLFDSREKVRVRISVHKDSQPLITLVDEEDKNRVSLAYDGSPHVVLSQPGGKPIVHMTASPTGAASLLFTHIDGHHNAGLGIHTDGNGFLIQEKPAAGK